jgi:hypothetical protein
MGSSGMLIELSSRKENARDAPGVVKVKVNQDDEDWPKVLRMASYA